MIRMIGLLVLVCAAAGLSMAAESEGGAVIPAAPNGIEMPSGYRDWPVLASSCRSDNNTMRVILGNPVAMQAAANGETNPWPDGTTFAKLVWKQKAHERWPTAFVPGEFVHVEFMVKDSEKYTATGGWGFARWLGLEQTPYGTDAGFAQTCFQCHTPMADNDYVFTRPAEMP